MKEVIVLKKCKNNSCAMNKNGKCTNWTKMKLTKIEKATNK